MIRLVFYAILAGLLALGMAWLAKNPGDISLQWHGWQIDTSVAFMFGFMAVAGFFVFLFTWALLFILGGPDRWRRRSRVRHYQKGLSSLTEVMVSLASGDQKHARSYLKAAEKHLGQSPATLLIGAQLAKHQGNEEETRHLLEKMLGHKETRLLAAKGLSEYHDRHAQAALALPHAQTAVKLRPKDEEAVRRLVSVHARLGQWQEAEQILKKHGGCMKREDRRHLYSILYIIQSDAHMARGDITLALSFARKAWKTSPELVYVAVRLIRLAMRNSEPVFAQDVLRRSWKLAPHPKLTEVAEEVLTHLAKDDALKAARKLAAQNPNHEESRLLAAMFALKAKEWEAARKELNEAIKVHPGERACLMMAELETKQFKDTEAASRWNARAADADEAEWACGECSTTHEIWAPYCSDCGAFDSLKWRQPVLQYREEVA